MLLADGPRHTPVQQGPHHLGLWHAHCWSERGSLHIVQLPLELLVACSCESDPSVDLWHIMSALALTRPPRCKNCVARLYLWPAASMTIGDVRDVWFGVHSSMISVFFSDTVRPTAIKTVTMTVIILARPSADLRHNSCVVGVQHAPDCPPYTC